MSPKGLFNKVKNLPTRQRYVVSTIRKDDWLFETAVFEANFLFLPRSLKTPAFVLETRTKDEAWDAHYRLVERLAREYPPRLFQEFA
jgi:hypothetical protein